MPSLCCLFFFLLNIKNIIQLDTLTLSLSINRRAINMDNKQIINLGLYERMTHYQDLEKDVAFNPANSIIIVKINFDNIKLFNEVLDKPFDSMLRDMFIEMTETLMIRFHASYAHVGIKDVTLVIRGTEKIPLRYHGKKQKLLSGISSLATSFFVTKLLDIVEISDFMDELDLYPILDVSIFKVPTKSEAANIMLWRERNNVKEAVLTLFEFFGGTGDIENKNLNDRINILKNQHGYKWDELEDQYKHGVYVKHLAEGKFTENNSFIRTEVETQLFNNTSIDDRIKRIFYK